MKLNDYSEEIYKCSGCGLCQSVCPLFSILKMESAVSRGKFKLLNAIVNKNISYSKKTLEYMELCLHCQACSEFCPSEIDAQKIIETAKYDMLNMGIYNFKKLVFANFFANNFLLYILKICINIARKFKILDFLNIFNFKKIKLLTSFLKVKIKPEVSKNNFEKSIKALYFSGCINSYINPSCANAVKKVFNSTEVEIYKANFSCCGLPLKSIGAFNSFIKIAKKNLDAIHDDFDYLIFDCASCKSTFLEYSKFLDGEYKEKAILVAKKSISVYELLNKINYKRHKIWKENTVTVHYPCHGKGTNEKEFIKNLLKNDEKTIFTEANNAENCCGASGNFILFNNNLSKKISKNKAKDIIATNANIALTTCPSCVLGIKQGLLEENSKIEVMQLIEYLAQ